MTPDAARLMSQPTAELVARDVQGAAHLGKQADRYLSALAASRVFAGSVRVARGDAVLFEKAHGQVDHARGVANSVATAFEFMSTSKSFTAVAVLRLVQQGALVLDARVADLLDALLDAATKALMHRPRIGSYACGWQTSLVAGQRCLHQSGGANGYVADFLRFPDSDVCIAVLSNHAFAPLTRISGDLAAITFGVDVELPVALDGGQLEALTGTFGFEDGSERGLGGGDRGHGLLGRSRGAGSLSSAVPGDGNAEEFTLTPGDDVRRIVVR